MTTLRDTAPPHPVTRLRGRNLIAVASGKGGVGKTWFSVTLSHALARMGRRVLLFDGDLGMANVDVQLGLCPERDIGAVIDGTRTMEQVLSRYAEGGFDVIAGQSGVNVAATITMPTVSRIGAGVLGLAERYDHAVLDLGAGLDRNVQHFAALSAIALVVITDEPTSLTDAYAFIKVMHRATPEMDIGVVVNLADNPTAGRTTYETIRKACRAFLDYEPQLAGIVRRDVMVTDAIRSQNPILFHAPYTTAARDVEDIAKRLARRG